MYVYVCVCVCILLWGRGREISLERGGASKEKARKVVSQKPMKEKGRVISQMLLLLFLSLLKPVHSPKLSNGVIFYKQK